MELKNALAVCLISLFSATLVLLVARSMDNQAARRLEPHLASIVEELEAIRRQGGGIGGGQVMPASDGVVMYYFHGNVRCPTCRAIESQAHAALEKEFSNALQQGDIVWKVVNYEDEANVDLKKRFDIQVPVVVLARSKQGEIADWRRLDQVWALWDDEPAFASFMQEEIEAMLDGLQTDDSEDAVSEDAVSEDAVSEDADVTLLDEDADSLPLPSTAETEGD